MNIREADIKCRGNGRSEIRRMTSGRMDDDMPDSIRQNEHTKKCRHTMPEKWTEIDGEKDGEGEERGIAGIPARTGHTQETENKKSPALRENGG